MRRGWAARGRRQPMFGGVENVVASLLFGVPAVKGVEFGDGFRVAAMKGSEDNDPYCLDEQGRVKTLTNHHGGALGGITSGMPLIVRAAIKPTASISRPQKTVDIMERKETQLEIRGRHDPCIVPRALPVVEAAVAVALLDLLESNPRPLSDRGGRRTVKSVKEEKK